MCFQWVPSWWPFRLSLEAEGPEPVEELKGPDVWPHILDFESVRAKTKSCLPVYEDCGWTRRTLGNQNSNAVGGLSSAAKDQGVITNIRKTARAKAS